MRLFAPVSISVLKYDYTANIRLEARAGRVFCSMRGVYTGNVGYRVQRRRTHLLLIFNLDENRKIT